MASTHRILNVTTGCWIKRRRAEKAILECAAKWVTPGESIRSLTLAESIAARNAQARLREPLEYAEIHGLRFDPPANGVPAKRREKALIWQAHQFATGAAT